MLHKVFLLFQETIDNGEYLFVTGFSYRDTENMLIIIHHLEISLKYQSGMILINRKRYRV